MQTNRSTQYVQLKSTIQNKVEFIQKQNEGGGGGGEVGGQGVILLSTGLEVQTTLAGCMCSPGQSCCRVQKGV